ncbi:MAG: 4Fe-4S cluster-binding domain-containing protein, partial [Nitrososphaerota archaeon]|nr:4Fe-4S cluster-binding domain-containing protein [Nitrososphaerota archaeon]
MTIKEDKSSASSFFIPKQVTKCTLFVTQECNLRCQYCYIEKKNATMTLNVAQKIMDFIFQKNPNDGQLEIGFFGGEPLLEFEQIKLIVELIKNHPVYNESKVIMSITSNGTIFNKEIADFMLSNGIVFCISCDGPQEIQDSTRKYKNGQGSSTAVERTIQEALQYFPLLPVNAVYSDRTLQYLPQTVDYLINLGVKNIYLNPDISAKWTQKHAEQFPEIYGVLAEKYIQFYLQGKPKFINLIDSKISTILHGGYGPFDRCRMGSGEFAFGTTGNVYPCERLVGFDDGKTNCIGNVVEGTLTPSSCKNVHSVATNTECIECSFSEYCMNWCGCTNYHSTGSYDTVSAFMCAHERAIINVA